MKKIILVRHGKSAWNNPNLTDHDRPLADRGLNDVPEMGFRLKEKGIIPDLIISSTATRASQTAEILAEVLHVPNSKIAYTKNLYHASSAMILKCIQKQDDSNQLIFLVGHNPGMNDFIDFFGGNIENLPTSGQYGFLVDSDHWVQVRPENVRTWFVDYPKK
ncbi:histidine phosphatase family protein [Algoriphagus sp. D3-2-R+10]|uniref:SixA phosphatase family protein n=1 Tax=Algoriphagus aurantiacus TaxID=3103948 RepID=UPI002B379197|nr:histidine phosphatase family protein [Algoriphagus sp. D3-2-R+10]MEB2776977.1 histidine phosphatase family protein [Algoriphagus sp. D3-2-R+10]